MHFLATTNRGLEDVAIDEIEALGGSQATVHHPGMVAFTGESEALCTLHHCARSLHRVLIERTRAPFSELDEIYAIARELDVCGIFGPDQAFAVRAQRHGDHEFGSPDVERVVGQAIVDEFREVAEERPPVDLDDPDVIFRVLVRHESVVVAVDATGMRSRHRRWYREVEHEAALRPSLAYAMIHLAEYGGNRRLIDPMCGAGTVPIEAALLAHERPPTPEHEPAFPALRLSDFGPDWRAKARAAPTDPQCRIDVDGYDNSERWIRAARTNARAASAGDDVGFSVCDATTSVSDADVVVTDLPFGIRTDHASLERLYDGFFESLSTAAWERLVLLTAREDLVPFDPVSRFDLRRGRLEVSLLVVE